MNAQPEKIARRKRKPPVHRVPTANEQRERHPFVLGWGSDLSRRQREAIKERFALLAGIGLAVVLAAILGWGWYQDNVAGPAAARAEANKPVAQVGSYTIRMGFFKRYETFEQTQLQNQQTQMQQQLAQLNANPKKYASQIQQVQAQQSLIQQEMGGIATNSLTTLINDQTMLQRSYLEGIPVTPKLRSQALTQLMQSAGGRRSMETFIKGSGLSSDEMQMLVTADLVRSKLQKKLSTGVSHFQTKVRASHILIPAKNKALAEKLYNEVKNGAPIGPLAKKYSTDTGSAKKGGDLGFFAQGTMVAPFDKAAFSMKVGQVQLVKSQYGWHIIKVTGRQRAPMTQSEYQQAQQGSFQSWLSRQQSKIHVQRFLAPEKLPVPPTPVGQIGTSSQIPGSTGQSQVPVQSQPQPQPAQQVPVQQQPAQAPGQTTGHPKQSTHPTGKKP